MITQEVADLILKWQEDGFDGETAAMDIQELLLKAELRGYNEAMDHAVASIKGMTEHYG